MNEECIKTRASLYPLDEPKASSPSVREAQDHLAACPTCGEFFREEREFLDWLRPRLEVESAPVELRERVLRAAKEEAGPHGEEVPQRPSRRRLLGLLGAAGGLALALVVIFSRRAPGRPGIAELEAALVEDHIRYLPGSGGPDLLSGDPEEVSSWFSEKLHFPVRAPELSGGRLQGARLCFLVGGRIALLFYEVQGRPLSFFVLDAGAADLSLARFESYAERRLCRSSRSGYQLVLWQDRGLIHAMVSDLSPETMLRLAAAS